MFGGACLVAFLVLFSYDMIAYPIDDCQHLLVDPDAMAVLELPAETQLALCIKHVIHCIKAIFGGKFSTKNYKNEFYTNKITKKK